MNKWVLFAQGWYKGSGETYDLVCELKKKVENKEIKIAVSLINIKETLKRRNEGSRNRLLEFIFELSQGNAISPFRDWIIDDEVENLFLERLGKKINIQSKVIRNGVSGIIGMEASLDGDISEELKKELIEKVNSLETFKAIFSTQKSIERAKEYSSYIEKATPKFEKIRGKERFQKDKKTQFEDALKSFLRDFLSSRLVKFFLKYGFSITRTNMNLDELIEILKKLPATHTYFSLWNQRDKNLDRKIKPNDLSDLMSFTMGIAYCDILFGEKMFVDMAKISKLDKLYNTVITSSLEEFRNAIF